MPLEHKMPKVIPAKGTKKVWQCTSGMKSQITVLACASASGQTIPPMVVFTGKYFNSVLAKGEEPVTLYGMSLSGWMDKELFADWFVHHFLEHAVTSRPLVLLLEGHSSHYTLELVKLAAEHHAVIFFVYPHIPQLTVSHLITHGSSHLNLTGLMFVASICFGLEEHPVRRNGDKPSTKVSG